jgi:NTE family protein
VLGGGGAKGGAEVGALKVLERAGIRPDLIVGTSIGSIVGGLYAAGYNAQELDSLFCQQSWLKLLTDRNEQYGGEPYKVVDGVTYVFGFPVIDKNNPAIGVLRGGRVEQVLDSMLTARNAVKFDQLKIPFACVAAEMLTAEEVVLDWGTVPRAIRASMAIPGIFKPVEIDGRNLVDGGMMNNLPVDVARQMGADIVIAIDLQQNKPQNRKKSSSPLIGLAETIGLGGVANWVASRPDITKYNENRQKADIYVNPPLPDQDATSFGNNSMRQMIAIGEQAMQEKWEELMKLIRGELK